MKKRTNNLLCLQMEQVLQMNDKTKPTQSISGIQAGGKDDAGNIVKRVLAVGNEYVIYEIDDPDVNHSIKIIIDGHTDESEKIVADRYLKVKMKYIEAKGILRKSSNFGMMKDRIAQTLASALSSDDVDGVREFNSLIAQINQEYQKTTTNRYLYILPAIILTIVSSCVLLGNLDIRAGGNPMWPVIYVIFGSAIGGSLSIMSGLNKYSFEEHLNSRYYFMLGMERIFLAGLAGTIAYIGIRSGLIFGDLDSTSYWGILIIVVAAGFSETLIPGMLNKINEKKA